MVEVTGWPWWLVALLVYAVVCAGWLLVAAAVFAVTYHRRSGGRWCKSRIGKNQLGSAVGGALVAAGVLTQLAQGVLGLVIAAAGMAVLGNTLWSRAGIVRHMNPKDTYRTPPADQP